MLPTQLPLPNPTAQPPGKISDTPTHQLGYAQLSGIIPDTKEPTLGTAQLSDMNPRLLVRSMGITIRHNRYLVSSGRICMLKVLVRPIMFHYATLILANFLQTQSSCLHRAPLQAAQSYRCSATNAASAMSGVSCLVGDAGLPTPAESASPFC